MGGRRDEARGLVGARLAAVGRRSCSPGADRGADRRHAVHGGARSGRLGGNPRLGRTVGGAEQRIRRLGDPAGARPRPDPPGAGGRAQAVGARRRRGGASARALDARVGRGVARLWANDLDGAVADLRAAATTWAGRARWWPRPRSMPISPRSPCAPGDGTRPSSWRRRRPRWSTTPTPCGWAPSPTGCWPSCSRAEARSPPPTGTWRWPWAAAKMGLMAAGLWAHHASMRLAVAAGDQVEVVRLADRMAHEPWGEVPEGVHHWRAAYVDALVAVGRIDDAAGVAQDLDGESRESGGDQAVGADAARAVGAVAAARRHDAEATAAFAAAGPRPRSQQALRAGAPRDGRGPAPPADGAETSGRRDAGDGRRALPGTARDPLVRPLPAGDRRLWPAAPAAGRSGGPADGP